MTLNLKSLKATSTYKPPRVVIYGTSGIGKSTLACQFPKAVAMDIEGGLDGIHIAKVRVASYADALQLIKELYTQEHDFKTLVIDSIDWMEGLVHKETADIYGTEQNKKYKSIEDIPYGKGYARAEPVWDEFLGALTALRDHNGMAIILVAHSKLEKFSDPSSATYDRYTIDLHTKAAAKVYEWADAVLFASKQVYVSSEDVGFNKTKKRGVAGNRVLFTEDRPSAIAKNRYSMPEELPLSFDELVKYLPIKMEDDQLELPTPTEKPTTVKGN